MDETRISPSVNSPLKPIQPGKRSTATPQQSGSTAESTAAGAPLKSKQAPRSDFATIGDAVITDITDLLPTEVLSSPGLRQTEWAWRQLIANAAARWTSQGTSLSRYEPTSGPAQHQASTVLSQVSENVMQTWWQALSVWTGTLRQNRSGLAFGRGVLQGMKLHQNNYGLLPFSQVSSNTYHQLPKLVQHEVLLDRVLSAVTSQNMPQMGSGVFMPELSEGDRSQEAVRWYAERTARLTRHGQVLDRLSIQFTLHDWPVEITFLSAKPTLYVHVRSDHPNVYKLASSAQPALARKLEGGGWRLEQWTVSEWVKEDDE